MSALHGGAGLFATAAPAAADSGSTYVFVVGSTITQVVQDDVFNAGRDNTVGSHNGETAATSVSAFETMPLVDWAGTF
ncbi:hypothetical protein PV721_09585 [Streptomyces sp. MB09-01]|uniref:hypothetical protein n=1 Tax=Streptomyces sp. MB09-01 TaxID=3028666 RepID=UPI0029B14511|nr:hypothetical protein [Streptomyces sp. MB09-01]MDX3534616.1 hypothetical protein [Streptomyces sp. MB09-01]